MHFLATKICGKIFLFIHTRYLFWKFLSLLYNWSITSCLFHSLEKIILHQPNYIISPYAFCKNLITVVLLSICFIVLHLEIFDMRGTTDVALEKRQGKFWKQFYHLYQTIKHKHCFYQSIMSSFGTITCPLYLLDILNNCFSYFHMNLMIGKDGWRLTKQLIRTWQKWRSRSWMSRVCFSCLISST